MIPVALNETSSARLIRVLLADAFPACRFSVRVGRGSMVSSITVRWHDGPTPRRVQAIVDQFKMGHFDGSDDSYVFRSGADALLVIGGVTYTRGARYVWCERTISPALANRCIAQLVDRFALEAPVPRAVPIGLAEGNGFKLVAADLDDLYVASVGEHLSSLIRRAANDRTEFAR